MKSSRRSLLAAPLVFAPLARAHSVPLFDGRTFAGWRRSGPGRWTIEDGAITGRMNQGNPSVSYLHTEEMFQDFRLNLEFWVSKGGNSGVFVREPKQVWGLRGPERPAFGPRGGYEVQINYYKSDRATGSLYGVAWAEQLAGGEEQWVPMEIYCNGPIIQVTVAGVIVCDYHGARVQAGAIGLQIHGGPSHAHVIRFRDVRLELL